jgi:hypothetical protein
MKYEKARGAKGQVMVVVSVEQPAHQITLYGGGRRWGCLPSTDSSGSQAVGISNSVRRCVETPDARIGCRFTP